MCVNFGNQVSLLSLVSKLRLPFKNQDVLADIQNENRTQTVFTSVRQFDHLSWPWHSASDFQPSVYPRQVDLGTCSSERQNNSQQPYSPSQTGYLVFAIEQPCFSPISSMDCIVGVGDQHLNFDFVFCRKTLTTGQKRMVEPKLSWPNEARNHTDYCEKYASIKLWQKRWRDRN